MAIYDFKCLDCQKAFTLAYKNFSAYENASEHLCSFCQSSHTARTIGRVAITKSEESRLDQLTDSSILSAIDENDPVAMGNFMKKMSQEVGGELGNDFDEVMDQLQSGEDPVSSNPNVAD